MARDTLSMASRVWDDELPPEHFHNRIAVMQATPHCLTCGGNSKGEEFLDLTGYECPDCFSNVFWSSLFIDR